VAPLIGEGLLHAMGDIAFDSGHEFTLADLEMDSPCMMIPRRPAVISFQLSLAGQLRFGVFHRVEIMGLDRRCQQRIKRLKSSG
jgi:hypothetical protein